MEEPLLADIRSYFTALTDPRSPNARHRLLDILVIAICAVICGAEGWEDIEEYGGVQVSWFKGLLDLPHGIPSHDTFRRVLARLDPEELTQCFLAWTPALHIYETVDADHGRLETRTYWITSDIDWLGAKPAWANLQSIGMVEARREHDPEVETATRFFLTSLPADAVLFAHAVRGHWHIENHRHWVLDMSFREDECRIRAAQGPQNFAVLRHIALNLLQREPHHKRGIKTRRKRAGWDHQYLLQVLAG
jgi:predicted transposase YbfD/YdcC